MGASGGGNRLVTAGSAPAVAAGANNGTTPPAPTLGSGSQDARGSVAFGSGATPAAGAQAVVTFATPYAAAPFIQLTEATGATAALNPYVSAVTANGFTISFGLAPAASQGAATYGVHYQVVG